MVPAACRGHARRSRPIEERATFGFVVLLCVTDTRIAGVTEGLIEMVDRDG